LNEAKKWETQAKIDNCFKLEECLNLKKNWLRSF